MLPAEILLIGCSEYAMLLYYFCPAAYSGCTLLPAQCLLRACSEPALLPAGCILLPAQSFTLPSRQQQLSCV